MSFSPSKTIVNDTLPRNVIHLIHHQTEYIKQLETENSDISKSLEQFKERICQVVNENQSIHDEMQSNIIAETVNQCSGQIMNTTNDILSYEQMSNPEVENRHKRTEITDEMHLNWKNELELMENLYTSQISGLKESMRMTEKILESSRLENRSLKLQLSQRQPPSNTEMSPQININPDFTKNEKKECSGNAPLIERLTREKNESNSTVLTLQKQAFAYQQNEASLRFDLQKCLALLEDVELQKNKIVVEKEQLKENLITTQHKLDEEIKQGQQIITNLSTQHRLFYSEEIAKMQTKISELAATCSNYEDRIEKTEREKAQLIVTVEESRKQMLQNEKDLARLNAEVKGEIHSALKGHSTAEQELRTARNTLEEALMKNKQKRLREETLVVELRRRTENSEKRACSLQELNVTLSQQLNEKLSELNQTKQSMEKLNTSSKTRYNLIKSSAEQSIEDLKKQIEISSTLHEQRLSSVEAISTKQANIIKKLRKECKFLDERLQNLSEKHREKVGILGQENEKLTLQTYRLTENNKELSEQCIQHGLTHRVMQDRLNELNERAHLSSNKVLDLLDKHTHLTKRKDVLNQEVEFLQEQVLSGKG